MRFFNKVFNFFKKTGAVDEAIVLVYETVKAVKDKKLTAQEKKVLKEKLAALVQEIKD